MESIAWLRLIIVVEAVTVLVLSLRKGMPRSLSTDEPRSLALVLAAAYLGLAYYVYHPWVPHPTLLVADPVGVAAVMVIVGLLGAIYLLLFERKRLTSQVTTKTAQTNVFALSMGLIVVIHLGLLVSVIYLVAGVMPFPIKDVLSLTCAVFGLILALYRLYVGR